MGLFRTVYYALLLLVTVLVRITWTVLVTTVLVVSWVVYNIITFNVRLLFTRIPWRLKKALVKDYSRAVLEKAIELSFPSMVKHAITLLSKSRGITTSSRRKRRGRVYAK